ncbi:MAG: hypothetical protein ACPGLV_06190 [Bacteroidia bacterium]
MRSTVIILFCLITVINCSGVSLKDTVGLRSVQLVATFRGNLESSFNNKYSKPVPFTTEFELILRPLVLKNKSNTLYPLLGYTRYRWQHLATGNLLEYNNLNLGFGYKAILYKKEKTCIQVLGDLFYQRIFTRNENFDIINKGRFNMYFLDINLVYTKKIKWLLIGPFVKFSLPSSVFDSVTKSFNFPKTLNTSLGVMINI